WPEIWRLNKEQIRNPHKIYPGDVIVLDPTDGHWRLSVAPAVRVSPTTRVLPLESQAIPSVPPGDIEPYLTYPIITGPEGLANAGEIVGGRDARIVRGDGDAVYAVGINPKAGTIWRLYRPGQTYTAPDNPDDILGYEQQFLGTARVERFADVSTLRIVTAKREVLIGDLLVRAPPEQVVHYAPHAPDREINGRILRLNRDAAEAGRGLAAAVDKSTGARRAV